MAQSRQAAGGACTAGSVPIGRVDGQQQNGRKPASTIGEGPTKRTDATVSGAVYPGVEVTTITIELPVATALPIGRYQAGHLDIPSLNGPERRGLALLAAGTFGLRVGGARPIVSGPQAVRYILREISKAIPE